jgi:hypothetical protein
VAKRPSDPRRSQLQSLLSAEPYNSKLKYRHAIVRPVDSKTFFTISCGKKGIIKPHTPPTGVVFEDGSFLRIYEKWSVRSNSLLEYNYHYQIPNGLSIRYDMDPSREAPDHPRYHIQTSATGAGIRMPSSEVTCEAVLEMIFEQFLK